MASVATLVIHGGAGTVAKTTSTTTIKRYNDALDNILLAGEALLREGANALDVVTQAVRMLEDEPLFNAGKGAVLTRDKTIELDAAVMNGADLAAGAVASVTTVRNPVLAARQLLDRGQCVMLVGSAAERFAADSGQLPVSMDYFLTAARIEQWEHAQRRGTGVTLDHDASDRVNPPITEKDKLGTVGAVAIDRQGRLAAATSTGGMVNKTPGRVGDSPLIGAGCYANRFVAVSATGTGEAFIKVVAAKRIADLVELRAMPLQQACQDLVFETLPTVHGRGGVIAIDSNGNVAMPFNTEGMYRGQISSGGQPRVGIFGDSK